jgi:hypothetical protein
MSSSPTNKKIRDHNYSRPDIFTGFTEENVERNSPEFINEEINNDKELVDSNLPDYSTGNNLSNIDKLTLELLINKTQYNKYIKQTNPNRFTEEQAYLGKINKYKHKIEKMFSTLLNNSDTQITNDIHTDFTTFIKTCIHYFDMKEMENENTYQKEDPDEDVLFGNMDTYVSEELREPLSNNSSSFYGKKINKIPAFPKYTMDAYMQRSPDKKR